MATTVPPIATEAPKPKRLSRSQLTLRRFARNTPALVGKASQIFGATLHKLADVD